MSTWSSRFGSLMSGRFSPFGRPGQSSAQDSKVTDADFSYITSEDLDEHTRKINNDHHSERSHSSTHHTTPKERAERPPRETDSLVFRHKKTSYTVHFPAYNIDDGLLTIGHARDHAARKVEWHDRRRVRMFWRGRNLKDDSRTCREEGMRSADDGCEILCVLGSADNDENVDSGEDSMGSADGGVGGDGGRPSKNQRRKERRKASTRTNESASATEAPREHLHPTHSHSHHGGHHAQQRQPSPQPPRQSSRQPSPQPPAPPTTPMGKLDAIRSNFEVTLMPPAVDLIERPPRDEAKRDFEHKRITETILTQVLMKLDGVETEGDEEARGRRKELVKDAQEWLKRLDAAVGKKGSSV